jgi:hypothetical protein
LLTQIHFTFSLINSLHSAVTTRLKRPSCQFITILFVQQIAILSLVCFSSISARHLILSTILFYCLFSLIQLLTGFNLTLPTVHNLSSLLVIRLFWLRLTVVCSAQGPFQFFCHAEDVCTVFDHLHVQHHTFADDMQVYVSCQVCLQPEASRPCHSSPTATALAVGEGANYFQVVHLHLSSAFWPSTVLPVTVAQQLPDLCATTWAAFRNLT